MAIRTVRNQYGGVNAHLHSLMQAQGGWSGFHNHFISDLTRHVQQLVRPLGYIARSEESIQIRSSAADGEDWRYAPDVVIYDPRPMAAPLANVASSPTAVTIPLAELQDMAEDVFYGAVAVYTALPTRLQRGRPLVWIEILSPTNKARSEIYQARRRQVWQSGTLFIELDYLHHYPPTFDNIPPYRPRRGQEADPVGYPYYHLVINPQADRASWQAFRVDDPIPALTIPLSGADQVTCDLNAVYGKTFSELGYGDEVDYASLPERFDLYQPFDQLRIVNRMVAVIEAAQAGVDLETAGIAPLALSLHEALRRISSG